MKLRLIVLGGSLSGTHFELEEGSLLMGRGKDSTIRFDAKVVSSQHATIHSDPNGFYIVDQQSTNGTFLNGRRIEKDWLNNGDILQLGNQGPQLRVTVETGLPVQQQQQPVEAGIAQQLESTWNAGAQGGRISQTLTNLRVYNPEKEKSRSYLGIGAALAVTGVLGLIVLGILISNLGFAGVLVGVVMAFTPAPFYLLVFLWLDRFDPEPAWALAASFAWGGLFAIFVSYIINTLTGTAAAMIAGPVAGDLVSAVISAPLFEEASKGLGLVLILIFMRKEFDGVLDGIVYAGVVGLGFATVENVLYYGGTFLETGFAPGLLFIMFLRGVLSPFIHSFFTSMTGIGCGLSRETHNPTAKVAMPIAGYFVAVTLHALWNGIASLLGVFFYVVYFVVWIPLFLVFLGVVLFMARRERRVVREMLAIEVAGGLITPQELDLIASLMARFRWVMASMNNWQKLKARRNFLRAVTKLAFCYWHVARAAAGSHQTISLPQIPRFKAEVTSLKSQIY